MRRDGGRTTAPSNLSSVKTRSARERGRRPRSLALPRCHLFERVTVNGTTLGGLRSTHDPDALGRRTGCGGDGVHLGQRADRHRLNLVDDLGGHVRTSALPAKAHPPAPSHRHYLGVIAMGAMHVNWHDNYSFPLELPGFHFSPGVPAARNPAGQIRRRGLREIEHGCPSPVAER